MANRVVGDDIDDYTAFVCRASEGHQAYSLRGHMYDVAIDRSKQVGNPKNASRDRTELCDAAER